MEMLLLGGSDYYKQSTVPSKIAKADVEKVYTNFYQNYAITKDGEVLTWGGLKGYLFGTDDLGRDILLDC